MLEKIRSMIGPTDGDQGSVPNPAVVKEAMTEVEAELEDARDELAHLKAAHGDVLLRGSDVDLETHESEIARVERDLQRLKAARDRLDGKLEEARGAQADRKRERKIERARALKAEGRKLIDRYGELAEELVPVLDRLQKIDMEIRRMEIPRPPDRVHVSPVAEHFVAPNLSPLRENVIVPAGPGGARFGVQKAWSEPSAPSGGEPDQDRTLEEIKAEIDIRKEDFPRSLRAERRGRRIPHAGVEEQP